MKNLTTNWGVIPHEWIETLKEFARVALIAAVFNILAGLEMGYIDWRLVGVSALTAVLKAFDKYLHEIGKSTDNESLTKGLTRF